MISNYDHFSKQNEKIWKKLHSLKVSYLLKMTDIKYVIYLGN